MLLVNVTVLHSVICLLADADQYIHCTPSYPTCRSFHDAGRRELVISHSIGQGEVGSSSSIHYSPDRPLSLVFPFLLAAI